MSTIQPPAMVDQRTRERPMWSAYRVPGWDWAGHEYAPGDEISFDITFHDARTMRQHAERREGVIVELWVEPWWGRIDPLLYAEVDSTDGEERRVWFHRDHVSTEIGFALGQPVDGGLF